MIPSKVICESQVVTSFCFSFFVVKTGSKNLSVGVSQTYRHEVQNFPLFHKYVEYNTLCPQWLEFTKSETKIP